MSKDEITQYFDTFLNETGQFLNFKEWIEGRGLTLDDFDLEE